MATPCFLILDAVTNTKQQQVKPALLLVFTLITGNGFCAENEKIGVVFLGLGMEEEYKIDYMVGYQDHLYPIFPPGMMAGGHLEGGDCYTLIHYADKIQAEICSEVTGNDISVGTPIDAFCNEYENTTEYPVHSIIDHLLSGYSDDCSSNLMPFFMSLGHSTIDPETGNEIIGPHVDDPDGTGIGISDFTEMYGLTSLMEFYHNLDNHKTPYRNQVLRWVYGNDIPDLYGYSPDETELTNLKDALENIGGNVVVRHAWLSYIHNKDIHGNELIMSDSVETVFKELIEEKQVDRIVVLGSGGHFSNITAWGYCWQQDNGTGLSRVEDKTYYECINDLNDGYGPDTAEDLETLLTDKPWRQHASPNPLLYEVAQSIDPEIPVNFAKAVGDYPEFNEAALELLKYTVSKYGIDNSKALKVIVATHGYSGGYLNSAQCDSYFVVAKDLSDRASRHIKAYLDTAWNGTFEVAVASNEFSQPSHEGVDNDLPTTEKPMGEIMGTGEHIDIAINGKYVNELGTLVDNGEDNFDYIIVIPLSWDADNIDTIDHFRHETLGNHALLEAQGKKIWMRQGVSEDGDSFNIGDDFDKEYFTIKIMDASGWESTPKPTWLSLWPKPVKKGSADNPTTVILTGSYLSLPNGPARTSFTEAAVESILEAIENPIAGGYFDPECELKALNDIISFSAIAGSKEVVLIWKTTSEIESQGFDILRSESESGPYEKITDSPVDPIGNNTAGAAYIHFDKNLKNRTTYYYKIEHFFAEDSDVYGPVSAKPLAVKALNLFLELLNKYSFN